MDTTPQLEQGFIRLANEITKHFAKYHLSGNEWQVLWVVLSKTYGWNKKIDKISLTQFEQLTGLSRPSVNEALDKLVGKKVLVVKKKLFINEYSFNKLYGQWIVPKKVLVGFSVLTSREKGTRVVPKKVPKLVPKKEHTINNINNITKDNIQKTYTSLDSLTETDFIEIATKYKVPTSFVLSKYDDLLLWAGQPMNSSKTKNRNWKLTLMSWVKRDAIKIISSQRSYGQKSGIDATHLSGGGKL